MTNLVRVYEINTVSSCCYWFSIFFGIIFTIVKSVKNNKKAPQLSVYAELVDKEKVHKNNSSTITNYYLTFRVKSGDRLKFCVSSEVFNSLYIGDKGNLEFKGTQFIGFGEDVF